MTPSLFSQAVIGAQVQSGRDIERTRQLDSLSEMNKAEPASKASRPLSVEEADDPTIARASSPKHDPPPAARKAAEKAERLSKKGRHEEAIAGFRDALAIDPQYYEAANNLALELQAAGKADEAETLLRSLTKSAPEHVLAFSNLGTLLCQQRRYAEAEAVARQALEHHRYPFKSNFLLGAALIDQGRWTDEAKVKLEYAQIKYAEAKALLEKWPVKAAAN
ncbi:MAG: tetratricopeptide repeat protein [Bryobacteraceae bacterium]